MRVLITGSRNWNRPDVIWSCLDILARELAEAGETELLVVHGAAFPKRRDPVTGLFPLESADYLADMWCRRGGRPLPIHVERHPANWRAHRKRAGLLRNQKMVQLGADVVLAFHRDGSPGTAQCVELAERAEIPVQVIDYADLEPVGAA